MSGPDRNFWQERFESQNTPWDRGQASPHLQNWLKEGALRPCRIAVPGCGSGHDVLALAQAGFEVIGLDYTPAAVEIASNRVKGFSNARVELADVLRWKPEGQLDAVFEQTCLCALYPDHWRTYADQLYSWLRKGGKLYAQFMQMERPGSKEGWIEGPPYHCDINAMRALFPEERWKWPKPPYAKQDRPQGNYELALILERV